MTKITKLEDIEVYNEALVLAKEVFILCKSKSLIKEYSLCDQIKRASVSVAANIAEGFGRNSRADFSRFLSISLGSANETIALLDILHLNFTNLDVVPVRERYLVICKRIFTFRRSLS